MFLPANTFSAVHESRGERTSGSSDGTSIAAAGTANTKGSWTDLGAVTSFAYEGFTVCCEAGSAADFLVDIGISDGANRAILVPDLHYSSLKQIDEHNMALAIPIHVPAGSQLSARCQASVASSSFRVLIIGHSANPGGFPGYSRAIALYTINGSRGTAIDPGGTANTEGAWTQLVASSAADVAALLGVVGFNADTARGTTTAAMLLDIGVGASTAESAIVSDLGFQWDSAWDGPNDVFFGPFAAAIPASSRIAARARCSDIVAGDRTIDLAIYGLVP